MSNLPMKNMRRRLAREIVIVGSLLCAVLVVSLAVFFLTPGTSDERGSPNSLAADSDRQSLQAEPAVMPWTTTGDYRSEDMGIGLTILAFRIQPERMTVLYTLDVNKEQAEAVATSIELIDDRGKIYDVLSHSSLGSSQGISLGLLTVEPVDSESSELTLRVRGVSTSAASGDPEDVIAGSWEVPFLRNQNPGAAPGWNLAGRVAPDVVSGNSVKFALASGPGSEFTRVLIERSGTQSALFGYTPDGVGRPVTETEWHQLFRDVRGYDDPGLPDDWLAAP